MGPLQAEEQAVIKKQRGHYDAAGNSNSAHEQKQETTDVGHSDALLSNNTLAGSHAFHMTKSASREYHGYR